MTKRFFRTTGAAIILLFFGTGIMSAKDGGKTRVFLLGGQSNMVGSAQAKNLTPPYSKPFPKVTIWQPKTKTWQPLAADVVNKRGRFGPEIAFGHEIAAAFPDDDIRLVKYAAGGTALYNDWAPTTGRQYLAFMGTVKAALADLDGAKVDYDVAGMLWLQGESDAHENKAETYEANLTAFIAHMRTAFKTPEMPFIIARVYHFYGGKSGQAKIVRDAQVKIAESDKNVGWFDTDDCDLLNAGHYNAAGILKIGTRFAAEYKKESQP
jgi:hypothetical protein